MPLFSLPVILPRSTHYSRLGVRPEATPDEIRAASARLQSELKARGADVSELVEANAINLESASARAAHDAEHPPLSLMRLQPTWSPVFDDRTAGLLALRTGLEQFLHERGEKVYHPSDLTRTDFIDDFTYCPLLDKPEDS